MYPEHIQTFIPPEFDLKKYQTADMNLFDWAYSLSMRSGIYFDLTDEDIEEYTNENIKNGATPRGNNFIVHSESPLSVVKEITCFQALEIVDRLDEKMEAKSLFSKLPKKAYLDRSIQGDLGKFISEAEVAYDLVTTKASWLEVDLSCSEKEIKNAFDTWLKHKKSVGSVRSERKRREYKLKEFSEATLRRWHDSRVLAYLDIEAWNYVKGNKVTSKQYGDILFPEYKDKRDNTQYVNDTLKPLAKHLTDGELQIRMRKIYIDTNRQK